MLDKSDSKYKTKAYTIKDFFNSYKEYTDTNKLMDIQYPLFRQILQDYFVFLRDSIVEDGRIMLLPGRFGDISVRKYKGDPKRLQFDYKSAKELNTGVWHFNEHTDGYRYRFYWNKVLLLVKNCTKYQMIFTRANKRHLAEILNNRKRDYLDL